MVQEGFLRSMDVGTGRGLTFRVPHGVWQEGSHTCTERIDSILLSTACGIAQEVYLNNQLSGNKG